MNRLFLLLAFALAAPAFSQTVYKCPGADGRTVYQQSPCQQSEGKALNITPPPSGNKTDGTAAADAYLKLMNDHLDRVKKMTSGEVDKTRDATKEEIELCLSSLKKAHSYKDPDSIKIEGEPKMLHYSNGNYSLIIDINAKNSYGGYVGAKTNVCYFDDKGVLQEVL